MKSPQKSHSETISSKKGRKRRRRGDRLSREKDNGTEGERDWGTGWKSKEKRAKERAAQGG